MRHRSRPGATRPRCWRRNSSAGRLRREGPMIHDQDGDRDQTAAMMMAIGLVMSPLDECRRTTVSIEYRRRRERHVVNRAHRQTISAAPEEVSQSRRNYSVGCCWGLFGGAMSDPSPTTHCFNVSNNRRVRLGVGAAAMGAGIVVLAYYGSAIAASTEYAVDGLAVGTQLNFNSASYREYKCSPSDQFDGLTWCQKTRSDKERLRSYIAAYSLLHSRDGNILYINRSQQPAFFNPKEAEANIQRYSRKIGESPRIIKMPHRGGLPDGLIAVWGKITLEPLDQQSMKILADGKGPRKGLLIDFLGNFARSAKEGLPIYHIDGGPG